MRSPHTSYRWRGERVIEPIKRMRSPHTSYRWRRERVIEPIKCMRSPHISYRWRGERVIEPVKWMGIIRRPWLTRASGGCVLTVCVCVCVCVCACVRVCVCACVRACVRARTLDGLNAEHKFRVWVMSLSHILEIFHAKPGTIYLRCRVWICIWCADIAVMNVHNIIILTVGTSKYSKYLE